MVVLGDLQLQAGLERMLGALRENIGLVDIIFKTLPAAQREEIRRFFSANKIPVGLQYPRSAADLPGLYVNLGSADSAQQFIGSSFPDDNSVDPDNPNADGDAMIVTGDYMNVTLPIACISTNANLTSWLSAVTVWALLGLRDALEEAGIVNQSFSVKDLGPEARFLPDFTFRRDVVLRGMAPSTFEVPSLDQVQKHIVINPTITLFTEEQTLNEEDTIAHEGS